MTVASRAAAFYQAVTPFLRYQSESSYLRRRALPVFESIIARVRR